MLEVSLVQMLAPTISACPGKHKTETEGEEKAYSTNEKIQCIYT